MTIAVTRFEKILKDRKAYLEAALQKYEASLEQPKSPDFEEGATERLNDEVIEGLGLSGQSELRLIGAALDRIKAGDYGICAKCGNDIMEARLEVVPHAALCQKCA